MHPAMQWPLIRQLTWFVTGYLLTVRFIVHAVDDTDLLTCYNRDKDFVPSTFEKFLSGQPSRLYLHEVLWSSSTSPLALTVVTGLTLSRLDALEAQCQSWEGPLSAAIYIVLEQPLSALSLLPDNAQKLEDAWQHVKNLVARLENDKKGCKLTVLLLYELVLEHDPVVHLLPINALRNAALLAAKTQLVAMIDTDLLISSSLAMELRQPDRAAHIVDACSRKRFAIVLPAFETHKELDLEHGAETALRASTSKSRHIVGAYAGDKKVLASLVTAQQLHAFAAYVYVRGHNATDYARWLSSPEPYRIEYAVNYEPWFIIERQSSPLYDVQFRGYGWNKVQHVAHVNSSGFQFWAHPDVFLVHRPHPKSQSQAFYTAGFKANGTQLTSWKQGNSWEPGQLGVAAKLFHRKVAAMRHVALRDMKRGIYVPVVDVGSLKCRQELSWWKPSWNSQT